MDYSEDALKLSREALKEFDRNVRDKVIFIRGDAKELPFVEMTFDKILMLDIIEHLHLEEFDILLEEAKRVLKDDGLILMHTLPNKWFYDFIYPVFRFFYPILRLIPPIKRLVMTNPYWKECGKLPKDPRSPYEKSMHVNEFSPRSLEKVLRKHGFRHRIKMVFQMRRQGGLIALLSFIISNLWPLNKILCVDIIAFVKK